MMNDEEAPTSKKCFRLSGEVADYLIDLLNTEVKETHDELNIHAAYNPTGCSRACNCNESRRRSAHAEEAYDTLRSMDGSNGDLYHADLHHYIFTTKQVDTLTDVLEVAITYTLEWLKDPEGDKEHNMKELTALRVLRHTLIANTTYQAQQAQQVKQAGDKQS
jgi:hypothetical protein